MLVQGRWVEGLATCVLITCQSTVAWLCINFCVEGSCFAGKVDLLSVHTGGFLPRERKQQRNVLVEMTRNRASSRFSVVAKYVAKSKQEKKKTRKK